MGEVELVVVQVEVLGDGGLHLVLHPLVQLEVPGGEQAGVGLVQVHELLLLTCTLQLQEIAIAVNCSVQFAVKCSLQ